MDYPRTPKGLATVLALQISGIGLFAWTAGYFARSPNATVANGAPLYLVGAVIFAAVAVGTTYSAVRRMNKSQAGPA